MPVLYYFTADFEALNIPKEDKDVKDPNKKTNKVAEQIPCSYSYIKVRYDGVTERQKIFVGGNAAQKFVTEIIKEAFYIREEYKDPKEMLPLTDQEQMAYDRARECWICKTWLIRDKVRDHCHITGKYRGPAHRACNLELSIKPYEMHIPVIFHNLSGYDGHIIMQGIGAMECKDEIEPIPYNMEKYMAFKLGPLRFIDSLQFMKSGLNKLAENLGAQKCKKRDCDDSKHLWRIDNNRCFAHPENFKITHSQVPAEIVEICLKKGVYPYEYMDSWDKFNETSLPPKEAFYSKLNNTYISNAEYKYAKYIWEKTKCKTIKNYHNIYFKTDVLLASYLQTYSKTSEKRQ
jgi:hypothetical protein